MIKNFHRNTYVAIYVAIGIIKQVFLFIGLCGEHSKEDLSAPYKKSFTSL